MLSLLRIWFQFLVRELKSHKSHSTVKGKKKVTLFLNLWRGQGLVGIPYLCITIFTWRGSKAGGCSHLKSQPRVWLWMLALAWAWLVVEHLHVDFTCCCLTCSQGRVWVPRAGIHRKIGGTGKAVSLFITKPRSQRVLLLLYPADLKWGTASLYLNGREIRWSHLMRGASTKFSHVLKHESLIFQPKIISPLPTYKVRSYPSQGLSRSHLVWRYQT